MIDAIKAKHPKKSSVFILLFFKLVKIYFKSLCDFSDKLAFAKYRKIFARCVWLKLQIDCFHFCVLLKLWFIVWFVPRQLKGCGSQRPVLSPLLSFPYQ